MVHTAIVPPSRWGQKTNADEAELYFCFPRVPAELLNGNRITKWDWETGGEEALLEAVDCVSNNETKSTPGLSADLFGDWREEVIWRTRDNRELRIYTTTIPTEHRFVTQMHDPQYRLAIAWQNVAYNQPPHPGFYLGEGMKRPLRASITTPTRLMESAKYSESRLLVPRVQENWF